MCVSLREYGILPEDAFEQVWPKPATSKMSFCEAKIRNSGPDRKTFITVKKDRSRNRTYRIPGVRRGGFSSRYCTIPSRVGLIKPRRRLNEVLNVISPPIASFVLKGQIFSCSIFLEILTKSAYFSCSLLKPANMW